MGQRLAGALAALAAPTPAAAPACALPLAQEVSFQWFKTQLLAKGVVEKLEVANKQTVKVGGVPQGRGCVGVLGGGGSGCAHLRFVHGWLGMLVTGGWLARAVGGCSCL